MAKKEKQPQQAAKEMAGGAEQAGRARVLHNGVYASVITAAAIALAIVVCLVMEALPRTYTEFDLSETGIYTLSDTTKEILGGLEQDVTLYYLAQTGNEDPFITGLLDRYAEHSGRVTWQQKDPALNPTFAGQYDAETIKKWLKTFYRRFFQQQFKRSCLPDGPKVGSVTLSPRGDFRMPSDACNTVWREEIETL